MKNKTIMASSVFSNFCYETGLQGWKYIPQHHKFHSLLWCTVVIGSIVSSGYLMYITIHEFQKATVSFNLETPTAPLNHVGALSDFIYIFEQYTILQFTNSTFLGLFSICGCVQHELTASLIHQRIIKGSYTSTFWIQPPLEPDQQCVHHWQECFTRR